MIQVDWLFLAADRTNPRTSKAQVDGNFEGRNTKTIHGVVAMSQIQKLQQLVPPTWKDWVAHAHLWLWAPNLEVPSHLYHDSGWQTLEEIQQVMTRVQHLSCFQLTTFFAHLHWELIFSEVTSSNGKLVSDRTSNCLLAHKPWVCFLHQSEVTTKQWQLRKADFLQQVVKSNPEVMSGLHLGMCQDLSLNSLYWG